MHAEVPTVRARGLNKRFVVARNLLGSPTKSLHAVSDVDLEIVPGATLALVGESGSGKSTTSRLIALLDQPDSGTVEVMGAEWTGLKGAALRAQRPHLQMVFQDPYASLNPMKMTVFNVGEPLIAHRGLRGDALDRAVTELLDLVRLPAGALHRYPYEFSGGQRQRLAIARALASDPSVIIADEAVSALDVSTQAQVLNLFREIQIERQLSLLFISHDLGVVRQVADHVAVMYLGRIVEYGRADEVLGAPLHPYTRELLDAVPRMTERTAPRISRPAGSPPSPTDLPVGCAYAWCCPLVEQRCLVERPVLRGTDHTVACHMASVDALTAVSITSPSSALKESP